MEKELEIKVLANDISEIKNNLKRCGGKKISEVKQINTVYDSAYNIIPELSYLRTRIETNLQTGITISELTYKENIDNDKVRENNEYTIHFDDRVMMDKILNKLSFFPIHTGEKHRESWTYKNAVLDFDTWDKKTYPKPYLEIEVPESELLDEIIRDLNIDKKDLSKKSISELQEEL